MTAAPLRRPSAAADGPLVAQPPRDLLPLDLIAALPLPVLALDAAGAVVLANAAAEAFLNASRGTLRDRGLAAALGPESPVIALIAEARARSNDLTAYDSEIVLAGGRTLRADVFVTPLSDPAGATIVTFQARTVPALVDRQRVGEGAARAAIGVAAMLAHEIKNPLSGIRGAAQLLGESADAEARELTTLIQCEVDRVVALIDRMEGFTDTRPISRTAENIHAVLGHVRQLAATGFARGIPIRERYDPSLPPVAGNHDALVQVFLNLVKNAAEAVTAAGGMAGEITLTTAYRHGFRVAAAGGGRRVALPIEVCVIDTGFGPAPGLARPYVRAVRLVEARRRRPRPGAGCQDRRRPWRGRRVRASRGPATHGPARPAADGGMTVPASPAGRDSDRRRRRRGDPHRRPPRR